MDLSHLTGVIIDETALAGLGGVSGRLNGYAVARASAGADLLRLSVQAPASQVATFRT